MKIDKKYLPSEQFVSRVVIIIIIIVIVFGIYSLAKFINNKVRNKGTTPAITLQIGDIIQKDSNGNGIADWEETLWGLDPKKNGESNKEFITSKKQTLSQNGTVAVTNSQNITDNEMLARQFFAVIISLEQNGELNADSMKSISESIGQNIETTPIKDSYTKEMLNIIYPNTTNIKSYYKAFASLVAKYEEKNIGDELTFIAQGLGGNDPQALYLAKKIAISYKDFSKELLELAVPSNLAYINLSLANDYEKTGQSLDGLTEVLNDPILGMKSIINYKKYSDAILTDIDKLSENF